MIKQRRRSGKTNNIAERQIGLLIQDDADYADGSTLFMESDNREQMCDRVGNYDIESETRRVEIQWINVLLLMRSGREPREDLHPPFGQIKFTAGGAILGKEIYMNRIPRQCRRGKNQASNPHMGKRSRKIFRNKAFRRKLNILLWGSPIRRTMIYGLRTKGIPRHLL